MKIKIRKLVNPLILVDNMVRFMGDSEYFNEQGELKMGYWSFLEILGESSDDNLTLDDYIEESELYEEEPIYNVVNDKGVLCKVKFYYM